MIKKILTFLFLLISSSAFAQSHTTFNKTDVDNIIDNMKTALTAIEIKIIKGTACYKDNVDDVSSIKRDDNCLWWLKNGQMISEFSLEQTKFYRELVIAAATSNITEKALDSYNMNSYVYKEINGETKKLNVAEYFQILTARDLDLTKKLTLIGVYN